MSISLSLFKMARYSAPLNRSLLNNWASSVSVSNLAVNLFCFEKNVHITIINDEDIRGTYALAAAGKADARGVVSEGATDNGTKGDNRDNFTTSW